MQATTQRFERTNKTLCGMSDVNYDSISTRQKLKGVFLERDKLQMSSYIKDLEKTLAINKEIIATLVAASKQEGLTKKIITSLNQENAKLQAQLKAAIKQRDSFQSKLLIAEQIIAEYKGKENDYEHQMHEKAQELLDQLNKKEYVLQNYERKFYRVLAALKKYSETDEEIQQLLKELNVRVKDERRITNIVEENAVLATEVQTARVKMAELESKLTELARAGVGEKLAQGWGPKEPEKQLVHRMSPTRIHHGHNMSMDDAQKMISENKLLRERVGQLVEENTLVKDALRAMQKKNEELHKEISVMREEMEKFKGNVLDNNKDKKETAKIRIKTEENFEIKPDEIERVVGDDSFGAASSIKGDAIVEFLSNE